MTSWFFFFYSPTSVFRCGGDEFPTIKYLKLAIKKKVKTMGQSKIGHCHVSWEFFSIHNKRWYICDEIVLSSHATSLAKNKIRWRKISNIKLFCFTVSWFFFFFYFRKCILLICVFLFQSKKLVSSPILHITKKEKEQKKGENIFHLICVHIIDIYLKEVKL